MASAFAHAFTAAVIRSGYRKTSPKILLAGMFCAVVPDADAIGFYCGIPYASLFGHRGFTHSILFAVFLASAFTLLLCRGKTTGHERCSCWFYLFLCACSHGLLDALTTGGLGVAFFSPFSNERYFLPWQVIKVSPMHAAKFFSERGWMVLKSELKWVGIPGMLYMLFATAFRKSRK
jgi:inner membrane protein